MIEVPTLSAHALRLVPSYSRIDTFTDCERRFLYDLLYPQPSSPAQAAGQAVHAQLERLVLGQPLPDGEALLPQAEAGLKAWVDLGATAVGTELWIDQVRDLPFSGKIDVLAEDEDEERFVVDWKTCKTLMHIKSQYEARRSLQLHIYCLAAECSRAVMVYLPATGEVVVRDVTFTPEELDVAYKRLQGVTAAIRSRWAAAGTHPALDGSGIEQPKTLDTTPFSLAKAEWLFCSEKWCPHFTRCLGGS